LNKNLGEKFREDVINLREKGKTGTLQFKIVKLDDEIERIHSNLPAGKI
jgi:hypothetical protein